VKVFLLTFFIVIFPLAIFPASDSHLVEIGKVFLEKGYTQAAKIEFEDALTLNPSNEKANTYLVKIRKDRVNSVLDVLEESSKDVEEIAIEKDYFALPKDLQSLEENTPKRIASPRPLKRKPGTKDDSDFTLKGEYQASFGIEGEDIIWKRANADLNEKNWRILDSDAYNRRENTFDPAVYSGIKFEINRPAEAGWGFHSNFDISPWSFIGKSNKITLTGSEGDTADIQLKYWSNSHYTVNETIYTNVLGDSFSLPELKVVDGKIQPFSVEGSNDDYVNLFSSTDELDIGSEIWPVREFWFDYIDDGLKLKIFPVAMENAAYSSDDPLSLTNRHTYWEESQWLINWKPGHFNSGATPVNYFKGWWDDSLAFFTRDSAGEKLTALRGFSLNLNSEKSMLDFTAASPKELWQDYDSFNTFQSTLRGKYFCWDDLTLGFVYGSKLGYNERALDAFNHFLGIDFNLGLGSNTEFFVEAASSRTEQDRQSDYETEKLGNSFQVSMINSTSEVFGKDYFGVLPKKELPFYKLRLSLTHMDEGFESALASFRETRDDTFWSRHISFRKPFDYYFVGLDEPGLNWDSVKTFAIGDGIDYGRDTISLRIEVNNLLDNRLGALFDVRNVHNVNGKYIENVTRLETAYQVTNKLTTKLLGIYHDLPKTVAGIDPFVINSETGDSYQNLSIEDGKDPSLKTISLGAKYDFFDWLDANFTWEYTNDSTLAYDDFPRGALDSTPWFSTYSEYGKDYSKRAFGLYRTSYFPLPPYSYFNIFKVGIGLKPKDNLEIYLDYGRNEYEWAQIIDDNTNHLGFEISYLPTEKLGFYGRYVYSKCKDISELNEDSRTEERSHHTFFSEARFRIKEDSELIAQYGVGGIAGIAESTYSPFGGGVATLDTQHIVRVYYRKKF